MCVPTLYRCVYTFASSTTRVAGCMCVLRESWEICNHSDWLQITCAPLSLRWTWRWRRPQVAGRRPTAVVRRPVTQDSAESWESFLKIQAVDFVATKSSTPGVCGHEKNTKNPQKTNDHGDFFGSKKNLTIKEFKLFLAFIFKLLVFLVFPWSLRMPGAVSWRFQNDSFKFCSKKIENNNIICCVTDHFV